MRLSMSLRNYEKWLIRLALYFASRRYRVLRGMSKTIDLEWVTCVNQASLSTMLILFSSCEETLAQIAASYESQKTGKAESGSTRCYSMDRP